MWPMPGTPYDDDECQRGSGPPKNFGANRASARADKRATRDDETVGCAHACHVAIFGRRRLDPFAFPKTVFRARAPARR